LNANGVEWKSLKFQEFDADNVGVVAANDIARNAVFLRVPLSLLMTGRSAIESSQILNSQRENIRGRSMLAVHLMVERHKGAASRWHAYIDLLPRKFDIPMFWNDDERQLLSGSWILDRVDADRAAIEGEYHSVFAPLFMVRRRKRDEEMKR
jgi:SET domain-containing protein 6